MTDEQPAPCPLCGAEPFTSPTGCRIFCTACHLTLTKDTPAAVVAAWNQRAPFPEGERMERMEEALWRIAQWADAYPTDIFPEPDKGYYRQAHEVLKANGMTLDRISAAAMRHVVQGVGKIAKTALS